MVVPMIHVPNVRAAAEWYTSIGFKLIRQNEEDGEINWAKLSFENSEIMLDSGGRPSTEFRREVDLYILVDDVAGLYRGLKDRVELVEKINDTFYGMREFTIRDCNRFWITFGSPSTNRPTHPTRQGHTRPSGTAFGELH
jgi:uncharacterized glyoxalase superfamily protein PhnB